MLIRQFLERFTTSELSEIQNMCISIVSERKKEYPKRIKDSNIANGIILKLNRQDFYYWDEITQFTKKDFNKLRFISTKTIAIIETELKKRDLSFKTPV